MTILRRHLPIALLAAAVLLLPLVAGAPPATAQELAPAADVAIEPVLADLMTSTEDGQPYDATSWMDYTLADGRLSLLVRYDAPSVLELVDARQSRPGVGASPMATASIARLHQAVREQQSSLTRAVLDTGATFISDFQVTMNGIHVRATPAQLRAMAALPGVAGISRAPILELHNEDVRQHLQADQVADQLGLDGTGTTIAIIDTGIDYTHAAFGGPGTTEAFEDNNPEIVEQDSFPTDKVVGGYDFAGTRYSPACPASPPEGVVCTQAEPDADPIDDRADSPTSGHGTHVASTAAGMATETVAEGTAPGAKLVALKVFGSPVNAPASTELSSEAVEWVTTHNLYLDDPESAEIPGHRPEGRIDVINMSLGSGYGPGASEAHRIIAAAVDAGVTVVISAGNSGNTPYIVGSPSVAPSALTVSNTHARNTKGGQVAATWMDDDGEQRVDETATTDDGWAADLEETGDLTAELAWYGMACNDADGPSQPAQDVTEKIALVERGSCTFVEKVSNAEAMGAVGVLIFTDNRAKGGMAGECEECPEIPVLMIDREPGLNLRDEVERGTTVMVTLSKGEIPWLTDTIAPGSSRGPARFSGHIKPNVSAPGQATHAARAGSGTEGHDLSGTSMSGPAVAGVAALLVQRNHQDDLGLQALDISAMAMNYANPVIRQDRNDSGPLMGVTRQGAGLVDALASATSNTLVRSDMGIAELSFADVHVTDTHSIPRMISVTNLSDADKIFQLESSLLFEEDQDQGVSLDHPEQITVPGGQTLPVSVALELVPDELQAWEGYGPRVIAQSQETAFQDLEVDGFLQLTEVDADGNALDEGDQPAVPFHVMPRRSTCLDQHPETSDDFEIRSQDESVDHVWRNTCDRDARVHPHYLGGVDKLESDVSPDHPAELDLGAIGVDAGIAEVRQSDGSTRQEQILVFTVATAGPRRTAFDGLIDIYVDTNGDGDLDRTVRQWPLANLTAEEPGVFVVISAPLADDTLLPIISGQTISGGFFLQFDINESVTTLALPLSALNQEWDLNDNDVTFDFAVALRDGMNDYEVTDTFLGEDMAPDDLVEGGRFTYNQAANACLMAEGRTQDDQSVNLIGQVAGPIPQGQANAPLSLSCEADEVFEVGILSEYRQNMPGTAAWDIRRGTVGSTPLYLPYTAHEHELRQAEVEPPARMRVVHASPDAPAVDVWLDGEVVLENVSYPTISAYLEVEAGEHTVQVSPTGATEPLVIDATVELEAGLDYTVAATGLLASIEPLLLADDNGEPAGDLAHVRFVHLSPDAPSVDVTVAGGDPVLFEGIAFREASEYMPLNADTYDLEVRTSDGGDVVLELPDVLIEPSTVYTVFALGLAGDEPALEAVVSTDATFVSTEVP